MRDMVDALLGGLRRPLDLLLGAEQRVFLPFLASSALIAAMVWAASARRVRLLEYLFSRRLWLHRSSLLDAQVIFARGVLGALLAAPAFVSTIAIAVLVMRTLRHTFGVHELAWPQGAVVTVFTVAAFVADDFTRYLVHWLLHRVPALWELHKVHHSARVLTPFTLHRVHPVEGLLMSARMTVTLGAVTGLFVWMFPGKVRGLEVLGVDAIGFAFAALGANLRHSHVWLSYGPLLERLAISPAQHQVHHSVEARHHDRNFGAALAVWDWMFGTLYVTRGYERLAFGLDATEQNHDDNLGSVLVAPLFASLRALVPVSLRRRRPAPEPGASARP